MASASATHPTQVTGAVTFPTCSEYIGSLVPGEPVARSHWSDRLAGENQSVYRSGVVCSVQCAVCSVQCARAGNS